MILIAPWLLFSLIVGILGAGRTTGFFGALLLSLLLSPLIGLIIVLVSQRKSDIRARKESVKSNQLSQLEKLGTLKEQGILSEEEFLKKKKKILKRV